MTIVGAAKILLIFYGLENWSPFVLWRINISHCEKHLFSISKNFFDSLTFNFNRFTVMKILSEKRSILGQKCQDSLGFFPLMSWATWEEKNSSMMMRRLLKNPFRLLRINVESGVCHSFREIARISLSKLWKTAQFFSTIFLNFDTLTSENR